MRRQLLFDRDVICGLFFVALGGATVLYAQNYPLGTLTDMGPGYFPTILGGMLMFFGAIIGAGSLLMGGRATLGRAAIRPLLALVASPICFAVLLDRIGLPLSVFCAAMIACAARQEFLRPWAVLLSLVLAIICVLVFVTLLGVPVRLWPAAWQGF